MGHVAILDFKEVPVDFWLDQNKRTNSNLFGILFLLDVYFGSVVWKPYFLLVLSHYRLTWCKMYTYETPMTPKVLSLQDSQIIYLLQMTPSSFSSCANTGTDKSPLRTSCS